MKSIPHYDCDFYSDAFIEMPHYHYTKMRQLGPVVYIPQLNNFAITKFKALKKALFDFESLCSGDGIADLDQEVQIIRPVIPRYPDIAQKAGIEATVMLDIIVDEKGDVAFVKVMYCSKPGYGFEKNAVDAAKKLRFEPFLQAGIPVKVKLVYPINFVLVE